jgi:hypothetical protein
MSTKTEPNDDIGRASKAAAAIGAVFALAALSLYGTRSAISVVVGVAIAVANLLTMRAIIRALIQAPEEPDPKASPGEDSKGDGEKRTPDHAGAGRRGGVAWGVFAVLKIFILFGGVWILLTRGLVDPMPLVVGYGVLPLGIAASALWSSLGTRR